jgi:hypothetical protein
MWAEVEGKAEVQATASLTCAFSMLLRTDWVRRTAYGEPAGPSMIAFHLNKSASSTRVTSMPVGGDLAMSPNSCNVKISEVTGTVIYLRSCLSDSLLSA